MGEERLGLRVAMPKGKLLSDYRPWTGPCMYPGSAWPTIVLISNW